MAMTDLEDVAKVAEFIKHLNRISIAVPVGELEMHQQGELVLFEVRIDQLVSAGDISALLATLLALTLDIFGAPEHIATHFAELARSGSLSSATLVRKPSARETVN